jgi:hypothetical protein
MKCCICGTIKNCGPYLNTIFENMEIIGSLFEEYKIILYYDYSHDDTLEKLKQYKLKNQNLLFFVNTSPQLPYRTHRLALGRNLCLNKIREDFLDYEYFIMMDCDDSCAKTMNKSILNLFLLRDDWDSLSFDHPDGYYDTWALSKIPYVVSCHHFENTGLGQAYITNIINKTPRNCLINCISAFNGFAIYKTDKFINCEYDGRFRLDYISSDLIKLNIKYAGKINLTQNKEDCEHRYFHYNAILKNGARNRISPLRLFN